MGYCSRCGEISFGGKCRKCGGRAVASIANGLGSESQGSAVDRWQSQYASSILGAPEQQPQKTTSTPALNRQASRASYSARSPSLAARRCCANCSKRLYVDTLAFVEGDTTPQHYCADCYNRLFLKGSCRQCFKNVFRKDAHVEHNGKYWHHACFNCQGCRKALGDQPMVDLSGRPCCEPCLMAQEGQKHAKTASAHSARNLPSPDEVPPSSPTLSRYDSISSLSSFASSNASPFMRPRLDTRLFDSNDSNIMTSPIHESPRDIVSRATTPALSQASSGSVRSIDSVVSNVSYQPLGGDKPSRYNRQRTNSMPSLAQDILHGHQDSGDKKVPPPSLQRQRRQSTYFADKVQRCHECHDIANGITIRLPKADGFQIFHQSCLRCAGCKDIFTESDYIADGDAIYHPQCRLPAVGGVRCVQCFKSISGKFFKNNGKAYHPECFTCTSCVHVLDPGLPFYEIKGEAYCEPCTQNRTTKILTAPVSPIEDIDATSKIFAKRTKALPQLGGTKICPRCSKSVGFLEETPGPRASRWHKKCLTCGGCKKQMDSSATVLEGDRAEWIPFCRACRGFGSGGR
ncbi:hypothetical protein INT44_003792 [Umbelopsis vinacea]|uniref:LIM zinc-binding domain-containing protein n=1 Tax=Umbelopsis vinacea TaxID=44442 RepID=A0A8H7UF78_9FUNG|nr:hypothetical protein INT44_003792 [Umbelopsis vinacea]